MRRRTKEERKRLRGDIKRIRRAKRREIEDKKERRISSLRCGF